MSKVAHVWSPVEEIEHLTIQELPSNKLIKSAKVVCIDDVVVVVSERGGIYASGKRFRGGWSYTFGQYPWTTGLINCLHKHGVITKKARDQHLQMCVDLERKNDEKRAAKYLEDHASVLGIKLTPKQKQRIKGVIEK